MKTIAIITIPNRMITAGEYNAAYGHNTSHMTIFEQYVKLPKSATSWTVFTGGNIEINIEYTGKTLGKRNMESINDFIQHGFILEANVNGVELIEKPAPTVETTPEQYDDDAWFAEKVQRTMEEMQASRVAHAQACGFVPQEGDICVNASYAKYENYQEFSLFRYENGLWVYHTSMQVGIDRYLSSQGYKLIVKFGKYAEGYYSQHEPIEITPEKETTGMTKEITIYEQTNKNGVLYLYCEGCKPRGGKRGTLVVSSYDQFCAGCGRDLYEMAQDVTPEPQIGDKVRIHGVGFGSGATGKVVSQVFHEQSGTTTRYRLVDLPNQGSIAFSINELQIIPLVQCPRCQCLVHEDELEGGCPICEHPEPEPPDDDELSPEDITAIREAMSQPSLGPFGFAELVQVLGQERQLQQAWEQLQSVPAYTARFARERESSQKSYSLPYYSQPATLAE